MAQKRRHQAFRLNKKQLKALYPNSFFDACPDCGERKTKGCKRCQSCARKALSKLGREAINARHRAYYGRLKEKHQRGARKNYALTREDKLAKGRARNLKKLYGITEYTYELLKMYQGNKCALCGDPFSDRYSMHIDHDHLTGKVRGILCVGCNGGIAKLGDDIAGIERALRYLRTAPTLLNRLESFGPLAPQKVTLLMRLVAREPISFHLGNMDRRLAM